MWIWLGLAALALIGELATGTFYLLLVALGLAAGGVAAWFGAGLEWQLVGCGIVLLLGLLVLRKTRVLKKREVDSARNADVNLDIGQTVSVEAWSDQGTARVWYRGAHWQAARAPGPPPVAGEQTIIEMRGSILVLAPRGVPGSV
ncbi:NfeD family protein [Achromobacter aegrifaciens]|uniref:NfeD family protein n=1 Tax=Achromobacter aegrifaciens TaxID=1287736 RepID=UPI000F737E1F|nr:NfeD family protein [Achromobacter aegrifaciens]RSF06076.1 NfeD family protein [Achromobacter aegrifaciens]